MQILTSSAAPRPGELWEFPVGTDGLVGWVAVKHHPDDAAHLLMVPADTEAFVGPLDVAVALVEAGTEPHRRVVLRGSFARWVAARDLWFQVPGASVARAWRAELCERLVAERTGEVELPGEALAFEDDVLAPAAEALEAWAARLQRSLRLDLAGPAGGELETEAGPELLAAAGTSALDDLLAASADLTPVPEVVRELDGVFSAHTASLRVTPDEVQLEATGAGMPPLCLFLGPNGGRVFLSWVRHISGAWRSQPARLDQLAGPPLRLIVAGETFVDLELDFERPTTDRG